VGSLAVHSMGNAAVRSIHLDRSRHQPRTGLYTLVQTPGGTDFQPVFARAAQLVDEGERVAGVVYLTDLAGSLPKSDPGIPTLWLSTTKASAPFGRTVHLRQASPLAVRDFACYSSLGIFQSLMVPSALAEAQPHHRPLPSHYLCGHGSPPVANIWHP